MLSKHINKVGRGRPMKLNLLQEIAKLWERLVEQIAYLMHQEQSSSAY